MPSAWEFVLIGTAGFLLRLAVFLTITLAYHVSLQTYTDAADGASYKAYARAILGDRSGLTDYDTRVFPGYPALVAGCRLLTRLPVGVSALLTTWVSAGCAASLSAAVFRDRRVGWAMVMLIPHWPINSSLVMGEAPMLALTLGGLLLGLRKRTVAAGVILGFAGLVRPVACFAVAGIMLAKWASGDRRAAATIGALAASVAVAGLVGVRRITGDALHGVKVYAHSPSAYGGKIFDWPFQAIVQTPLHAHVPAVRIVYVWIHVLLLLAACVMVLARARRQVSGTEPLLARREYSPGLVEGELQTSQHTRRPAEETEGHSKHEFLSDPKLPPEGEGPKGDGKVSNRNVLNLIALPWLLGNTLFALCVGSGPFGWGFYHFPRFTIPATPAFFWAGRKALPRARWFWMLVMVVMYVLTVAGVRQAIIAGAPPRIPGVS